MSHLRFSSLVFLYLLCIRGITCIGGFSFLLFPLWVGHSAPLLDSGNSYIFDLTNGISISNMMQVECLSYLLLFKKPSQNIVTFKKSSFF